MRRSAKRSLQVAVACAIAVPTATWATNGYFAHGWGTKSKAMAGVATALPQDTLVSATNPAGMAFLGTSLDIGISFFNPSDRGYKANADYATAPYPATDGRGNDFVADLPTGGFVTPGTYDSDMDWFAIPSIGFNYEINDQSTIGVSIYGNGGMNTKYDNAVWENFAPAPNQQLVDGQPVPRTVPQFVPPEFGGRVLIQDGRPVPETDPIFDQTGQLISVNGNPDGYLTASNTTGVNLEQLFIEVPYTFKFADGKQSVGIAPVFAVQRFEARGLQPFRAASVNPEKVSNNGTDTSYGMGLHVGWYGEVTDQLALGISYRTKMWMTDFDDYAGLFANGGDFDIPAMFNLGVAYKITPQLTFGFDYQHVFYDEIDAISNSNDLDLNPCFGASPKPSYCLGAKAGLGFGWQSQDIFKAGLRWDQSDKFAFFGGVSYNTELLKSNQQALFNVLTAGATIRWHLTLGMTYKHSSSDEFNLAFAYMPKETVDGSAPSITQTQTGSLYMEQKDIELSWSHRF
jgi:long-chain fatty acid transport protein